MACSSAIAPTSTAPQASHNGLSSPHHFHSNSRSPYPSSASPIPANASFTYEIPIEEQVGTYWVHSHFAGQYVDGLRAPLLLHNPQEPYTYDRDITVVLGDWYHDQHAPLSSFFMSIANPGGAEPVPSKLLVSFLDWEKGG